MEDRYIETIFKNEKDLIDRSVKTRNLNVFSVRVRELQSRTSDDIIRSMLSAIDRTLEDCYSIDMYKFQFNLISKAIGKDLDNIEQMIEHE